LRRLYWVDPDLKVATAVTVAPIKFGLAPSPCLALHNATRLTAMAISPHFRHGLMIKTGAGSAKNWMLIWTVRMTYACHAARMQWNQSLKR
jgi:hypothetical protein